MAKKLLILWELAVLLCLGGCGKAGPSSAAEASREEGPASSLPQSQPAGSGSSEAGASEADPAGSDFSGDDASEADPAGSGSSGGSASEADPAAQESPVLKITVDEHEFLADFASNPSAQEFQELLAQGPVTVQMEDYGGFEKVGPLGTSLTPSDESITTQPGDVILYQGSQITIYYGTNTWTFTRLAKIRDPQNLKEKLGDGAVEAVFSLEQEAAG